MMENNASNQMVFTCGASVQVVKMPCISCTDTYQSAISTSLWLRYNAISCRFTLCPLKPIHSYAKHMYDVHFYRSLCYYYSMHSYACYFLFEGRHWTVLIPSARVESPMSRKTSTRVAQVTGCLPLPASHCWRISVLIRSGSFEHL